MLKRIGNRLLCVTALLLLMITPVSASQSMSDAPDGSTLGGGRSSSEILLIPGGDVFGARLSMGGVMVVGLCEVKQGDKICRPAADGGIRERDLVTHVNGTPVHHAKKLTDMIEKSEGKAISLTVCRKGERLTLTLTPVKSSDGGHYRLGLIVRDRTAGIGTITFIDPSTGAFGGLGHGICDPETGEVIPLSRGNVTDVHLLGITRGESGAPGELRGVLGHTRRGILTVNSESGVFGILTDVSKASARDAIPLGHARDVKVGKAEIVCTLADGEKAHYEIEITKLHEKNKGSKCFSVRVTDPRLIEKTGGIVQGMSGSPIIQDGKLVGAVTHVMLNDPACGYGIFIENMLNAAQMPMAKAS